MAESAIPRFSARRCRATLMCGMAKRFKRMPGSDVPPRPAGGAQTSAKPATIGDYLIERLYALGVRHVFGIPGDYVLGFYDQLSKSKLQLINTCDEQGAGFAADAYARVQWTGRGLHHVLRRRIESCEHHG